nr:response regulator transcription factor [Bailinhaonella thermotolerans]
MTRLVIADDQALVRKGLRLVIESEPGLEVVGEAEDGEQAIAVAMRARPDVVLMDIGMPRLDGLAAARRLLAEAAPPRVIMLTTFGSDENLYAALRAGVSGFLLKTSAPEQLLEAIRVAAAGNALIDPAVTTRLIASFAERPASGVPGRLAGLAERELDLLRLLARGLSNAEIAGILHVTEDEVAARVEGILGALRLRDRTQAVVLAYESGLMSSHPS